MVFDYLIVGGGSAGCVLADRLSSDGRASVLLVESGPDIRAADEPEEMRGLHPYRMERSSMSAYRYDDVMARRTSSQDARPYLRGRGMGGSSVINGHLAIRGSLPGDFDLWESEGCPGWSDRDVLPYFTRLENDLDFGGEDYHGTSGPLPISRAPVEVWTDLDRRFRDAALEHGHPWSDDHNAPGSTGVSPFASILSEDGRRVSASRAYLEPARERDNVTVLADACVVRIEFEGDRAVGVTVEVAGRRQTLLGRETILCAGAIHSPAILLRSGVGPVDVLSRIGADRRVELPVGENLQDHASIWLGICGSDATPAQEPRFANCCVRYSSGLADAGDNDMFMSAVNTTNIPEAPFDAIVNVSLFQAFSRGRLSLTSADHRSEPVMDMQMVSDDRDRVRLRDGVRRLWAHLETVGRLGTLDEVAVALTRRRVDGLPEDDAALDRWVAENCQDAAHVTGTCRMGDPADPRTVVDARCRVLHTDGLRVVDASIAPEIPRANTQVPALMIAERAAAILLEDAGDRASGLATSS